MLPSFLLWGVGWGPCGHDASWHPTAFIAPLPGSQDLSSHRTKSKLQAPSLWQEFAPIILLLAASPFPVALLHPADRQAQLVSDSPGLPKAAGGLRFGLRAGGQAGICCLGLGLELGGAGSARGEPREGKEKQKWGQRFSKGETRLLGQHGEVALIVRVLG